tara:strand:- start:4054 stop:4347 length:294 start_codon:yes stop_codon:yes gene_type:complete
MMAVKGDDVTIQNSGATVVWTATQAASVDHPNLIWVENADGSIEITVGGSDVADDSNGLTLGAGKVIGPITLTQPQEVLYAIAASGTPKMKIFVTGV